MDHSTEYHKDIKPELYVSLDGFEGPLDLLLTLAKKQKVDLKKLQLGILADQFLDYLRDQRYKFKLEFAGDYLVMASWLTLLKSQLIVIFDFVLKVHPKEFFYQYTLKSLLFDLVLN